ncbi:unnamed protein product [Closterium sp. Naga37s-1]|nr:unnamed protein product [Closterium sp. Naga37s-1]
MSRTDMVHYVDVQGGWDTGECAWCFDRAVAYRSEHALGKTSASSFPLHLIRAQSPDIPPAPPSRPSRAMLEFSWSVPVQRLGGQQGGEGGQQGVTVAPREQLVWKCEQAPLLCVQAMLLEWLAEPRVGVLMDLRTIRSRLPAILGYTPAAAHCSAPTAPATSSSEASRTADGGSARDSPAAPSQAQPAAEAWSCCWRCSSCWGAYRRAVSFAAFLVLVARSPRVTTLWKTHMNRSETFAALVTALGAGRQAQPDCFASILVQLLGVKDSADLQEGFGFFLQHLLPGGPEKAVGKVQAEGKGGSGKKAAALGNAGPAATAAMRLMGGGRGAEGIGGSSAVRGSGDEEDGGEGDGGRQGPVGGGGEGGGDGQGGQWRKHLKGRVWERFGAIPKPLEGSSFSLEWDEWPHGDEAAVKFPDDPSGPCFGLGIVGESGMGEERGSQSGSTKESEVTEESGAAEEGEQSSSEPVQRAVGKGKAGKGRGKRGKGGKGSGGKKAEGGDETITSNGKGQGNSRQPRLPIIRCRADVDFLIAILSPMIMPPDCSHCLKCLGTFVYHVPCCALIANFAYRPVEALFARFLSAYPTHSLEFDQLFKALLLRSPLTVAEHVRLINESSPAGAGRGMSALRHRREQMTELPRDPGMRERVMLLKARQMPLFFLLGVAVYYSKPIMGMSDEEEVVTDAGDVEIREGNRRIERKRGNGGRVGVVDGGEEGEEEEEDDGEVWHEVESWGFAMLSAWRATTKVMGPGLDVTCGRSSPRDVLPRKAGAPMSREWGVDMWAQAATPRFRDDLPAGQGGSGNDGGDSGTRSGSSGSGGGKSEGEEEKGEEPAYLKPWPGGINLVACLREMLLGEVCYRPAPPSASSSHPAATNVSASSGPAVSSAPGAPSNAAAAVSVADGPVAAASGGRVCGAAGCGRVEGGGMKLRNCSGCGKVAYCSRECQKAHWPSHKLTCPGRTSSNQSGTNSGKVRAV